MYHVDINTDEKNIQSDCGIFFSIGLCSFQYYHERSSMHLKVSGNITLTTHEHFRSNIARSGLVNPVAQFWAPANYYLRSIVRRFHQSKPSRTIVFQYNNERSSMRLEVLVIELYRLTNTSETIQHVLDLSGLKK